MDDNLRQAYDARHKQAFRVAFDTLKEVWPPENNLAYFEKIGERMNEIYSAQAENPLCKQLLMAVYNYLGIAVKELEEVKEQA